MEAKLRVIQGPLSGQVFSVSEAQFLIGRERNCQMRPNTQLVSRHHCVLRKDGVAIRIRDLGSKNGTFVNGRQIHSEAILSHGDTVIVGDVTLQIVLRTAPVGGSSVTHAAGALSNLVGMQSTGHFQGETVPPIHPSQTHLDNHLHHASHHPIPPAHQPPPTTP